MDTQKRASTDHGPWRRQDRSVPGIVWSRSQRRRTHGQPARGARAGTRTAPRAVKGAVWSLPTIITHSALIPPPPALASPSLPLPSPPLPSLPRCCFPCFVSAEAKPSRPASRGKPARARPSGALPEIPRPAASFAGRRGSRRRLGFLLCLRAVRCSGSRGEASRPSLVSFGAGS